ncbi:M28 family peptidase [Gemmatimonadota bacterium]
MTRRSLFLVTALLFLIGSTAQAQMTPWYQWTFVNTDIMDEIVGEASGETAFNTIMETGGYNKDRQAAEYAGTFYETQYIYDQLVLYGLPGAEIVRFPGGSVWDGIKGELWEETPMRQKLASFQDMRAMLASGSQNADVTAELVWVGMGTEEEIERAGVAGKIVVTEGSMSGVHRIACQQMGALGVICIANGRPNFDPLQIPWSGVGGRGASAGETKFGFYIPPREAESLKRRLQAGQTITVHAEVEATTREYDLEDVICHIPGTDPNAGEIILSAHMFEGYIKQGANDNKSGCAGILEVARTLHTLIEEGRIPRPKRTIRFLWGPEFSGTGPWVTANKDLMEETLCNINMDMVGESLQLNKGFTNLMRTSYGNAHYINDVMENYYRFVGESNRERIQNRSGFYKVPQRIVAPTGPEEPFYYSIETHYGASDHMVFNNWGVQVPGIMIIVWPDQWYHTSGDRVDKSDPTQMKRVAILGAAGAYTVASADDDMAIRIASETASNATRRLGHQFVMGQERLNGATAGDLGDMYAWARAHVEGTVLAEKATLQSILELATDAGRVGNHVEQMIESVEAIGEAHLKALEAHMAATATRLGTQPVRIQLTDLERSAARMVPSQTSRVKENGYNGYNVFMNGVTEEQRAQFPYGRSDIANTGEINLLINGEFSVLDIKKMLDAQSQRTSDLQSIINYIEILKLAGLVDM